MKLVPDLKEFAGELTGKDGVFTILHKLDAQAGKWFLTSKWFRETAKDWENVPVIFANGHPKVRVAGNLKAALESCNGKLMGYPKNVRVEESGHPKLVAELPINDAAAMELYKRGMLAPSTALDSPDDGVNVTGPVVPDHILLFPETVGHRPGDRAAMMFQEGENEVKSFLQKIWDRLTKDDSKEAKAMDEKELKAFKDEIEKKMADQLKTFEDEKAKLAKELEAKDKTVKEFMAKQEQEKKDNTWKTFKATGKVPPAWLKGKVKVADKEVDKESITRKEFEEDPATFAVKTLKFWEEHNADLDQGTDGKDETEGAGDAAHGSDLPEIKTIGNPQEWDDAKDSFK